MDLTSKSAVKNLFEQTGIYPSKKLGQNFLVSRAVLKKISQAADLKKTDIILEIGPGIGTLTQELAENAGKIIVVEKDKKIIEILKQTLKDFENVEIIHADILKIPNCQLPIANCYKIVANLPYYITSPVIRKFLETENPPLEMILMVQKEVAQRICAKPPHMNLLAVSVQFYVHPAPIGGGAGPEIISYISKNCFWPKPKVDSAIIKIILRGSAYGSALFRERFFKIVRAGFSHPRKQLVNNLSNGLALSLPNELKLKKLQIEKWLLKNNINPIQRAQTLKLQDWLNLAKTFKNSII